METILIIEDNPDALENTSELLELADYNVLQAENGLEGIKIAKLELPDLILCDIMMPELDGFGVLDILSKNELTSQIPIIFLTAKAEKEDFRHGMEIGADDYITKPFKESDLLKAIDIRLKKHRNLIKSKDKEENSGEIKFSQINDFEDLKKISSDITVTRVKKNQILFNEGNNVQGAYFVNSGKIKTYETNDMGKRFVTGIYKKGDFFGYIDLIKNSRHTDTAESIEESEICLIPEKIFLSLLYENKSLSEQFIKSLSNNVKEKEMELLHLAYDSVRQRVAYSLMKLLEKFQINEDSNEIGIPLSREDLAGIVGTSTESLIRTISDFKNDGVVKLTKNKIIILDKNKLIKISKGFG